MLAACAKDTAKISGILKGVQGKDIEVRQLNVNTYNVLDTVKTGNDGSFAYQLAVKEGDPEFIYLFYNNKKFASLILKNGDKVRVDADTLGACTVEGSEDSQRLMDSEKAFADFASQMIKLNLAGDNAAMSKLFVEHYRNDVKFVLGNPFSLANIPVLYESLNEYSPVFGQVNDALIFRGVTDSLKTLYPDSKYVKALEKETARREQLMNLEYSLKDAQAADYPDISLPDIYGNKVAISQVDSKLIMLHFWDSADAAQKMFNLEVLKPLYEKYHSAGLEIYAISLDTDKAAWAATVKAQELPWINVNDGLGAASPAVRLYNVTSVPSTMLLGSGDIIGVTDEAGLRRELANRLK